MKLKRHIKNHSLTHTFKQLKIENKSIATLERMSMHSSIQNFQTGTFFLLIIMTDLLQRQ